MAKVSHVTSSGFAFERDESTIVVHCARPLVPLAELEYLREVGPKGGRISGFKRTSGDGREIHLVTVATAEGDTRTITFDAGPALTGHIRRFADYVAVIIYVLATIV